MKKLRKKSKRKRRQVDPIKHPRASHTWTEARFWLFIRSALRRATLKWPPKHDAKKAARRPSRSSNKRLKWEYQCRECERWFPDKQVELDHVVPAGELNSYEDLPGYVERLFCEKEGYQVLCQNCHNEKTRGNST